MTHIVEQKSLRYTWELVRHTYIVDLESEIEIQQVVISPSQENRLLDPPCPLTPFFEVEIDQIQKNGKTVFSFRNICPVQINRKPDWDFLNCRIKIGSSRVTQRFQSQERETETRWLYTDDFFLISCSSGDRHDLSMLLSLIIGKLNMIALSIQSGRRIRSEFENQQKYRAAMSTMFSEGVDGAFRDIPVYQQHGDMTGSDIDVSAALMSVELQDLTAECAAEKSAGTESVPAVISTEPAPVEETPAESTVTEAAPAEQIGEGSNPFANIVIKSTFAETVFDERAATPVGTVTESASVADSSVEGIQAESIPEEKAPVKDIPATTSCSSCGAGISNTTKFCGSCGAAVSTASPAESSPAAIISCSSCGTGISGTKKFCGRCGAAVSHAPAAESAPVSSGITAHGSNKTPHSGSRSAGEPVVNLKSIEELDDLSWLTD